ncbi:hypothetical protein [Streptomyces sp. NPDC051921]|uniref:SCO2400 family protein n=1 Tax=Streptomyces sp. NPDC051921 TaxID=3155806 RepID=UPI00341CBC76
MDYCHQCRRHLNGALACAGCGTPAEELRYFAPHQPTPAPVPTSTFTEPAAILPPGEPEYGHAYELEPLEPARPAEGRAAARRGRSRTGGRAAARGGRRARSRRGRTVLLGTLGFALAAGSLSMAKLALEQPDGGGAATAVQEEDVVEETLDPDPPAPSESTARPDGGPGPVESVTARPTSTGHLTRGSGRGVGGGGAGSGDGAATGTGDGTGTGSGDDSGASPTATPPGPEDPSGTPSNGPSGSASPPPGGGPTAAPGPQTPSPTPSPTPSCTRFLWWCV